MIVVFVAQYALIFAFDIYRIFPNFDIIMHGLGGFVSAWTIYLLYKNFKDKYKIKIEPIWVLWMVVIAGVALIGVGWELAEFAHDKLLPLAPPHQMSIADTMEDFVMDLVGVLIFLPFIGKK